MLNLNTETVRFIIDKAQAFQMLGEDEAADSIEGPDPAYAELKTTIQDLEPDQQISLVALMWLGRGGLRRGRMGKRLSPRSREMDRAHGRILDRHAAARRLPGGGPGRRKAD